VDIFRGQTSGHELLLVQQHCRLDKKCLSPYVNEEVSFCLVGLFVFVVSFWAHSEELRQLPANRDQTDNQLLGGLAGKVISIVYPETGATFAVGCERYPEGAIPTEIKERPEGTKINELTFWSI